MKDKILNIVVGAFALGIVAGSLRAESSIELDLGLGAYGHQGWGIFTMFVGYTEHLLNGRMLLYANGGFDLWRINSYGWYNRVGPYVDGGIKFIVVDAKYTKPYIGSSIDLMKTSFYDIYDNYIDAIAIILNLDAGLRIHFFEPFGIDLRAGPNFGAEFYSGEVDDEIVAEVKVGFGYHVKGNLFYIF